jgi:hypothetical protein
VAEGSRVHAGLGELLVPLGLGGLAAWGGALEASGLGGFSVLGVSSPCWGSLAKDSGSISCESLHMGLIPIEIKKNMN